MKNKTTFTPGPWSMDTRGGGLTIRATDKPNYNAWDIAHVTSGDRANAALIAAAPELLAALERVLECHRLKISLDTNAGAVEQARAAIAKARGEK